MVPNHLRKKIKSYENDGQVGRMYLNGRGIVRYVHRDTEAVALVLVSQTGYWIDAVTPLTSEYWALHDEAPDGTALLLTLGRKYFGQEW